MQLAEKIVTIFSAKRFINLDNEKRLQEEVSDYLNTFGVTHQREYIVGKNIFDIYTGGVVIEIKIKGSKREIYKQCKRYAELDICKAIILMTGVGMGFPEEINGKPCYVIKFGKQWL